jgi:hypothetical protein
MDCIDSTGNVFIGYSAGLNWKQIHLDYSSILYNDPNGTVKEKTSIKKSPPPTCDKNKFTWATSRLNVKGNWQSIDPPLKKEIFDSETGLLDWQCFQPKAKSQVWLPSGSTLEGLGYTERVTMTIKPWELPIDELRWGRFLSEEDTIVWIYYKGSENMNLLYYQGNPVADSEITDTYINLKNGDYRLNFSDTIVLRDGYLISTVLSNIPGVRSLFPKAILNIHECKWRSKGVLLKPNNQVSIGWVIHEVVKWEKNT